MNIEYNNNVTLPIIMYITMQLQFKKYYIFVFYSTYGTKLRKKTISNRWKHFAYWKEYSR